MNFKRIEIFGFKSFADKVDVAFNDGITGIVGPNGCGKSNVADAIRWVLGEQSAKLLRGKSMQDVIFNGTARRKALSVCEVSLVFDNSAKIFPNVDYDEIVITRKLFRSGDSEYYINRTPCRLRDIQDLIRDTGLGREGYSIVGQGRIDEIVNARPKDRRAIFEDAAGVLKFKQRKIESERKLARTRENIDRLEDIINEIGRRLAPLEKQSNDAKKYLELRDQLRSLEVNEYLYQYENSDSQKQNVQLKLDGILEDLRQKSEQQQKNEQAYQSKQIELSNVDTYIGKLRDRQTELAVQAESIKGQGSTLSERISNLREQRENYARRIVVLEDEIDTKSAELHDYTSRLSMEQEDYDEINAEYKEVSDKHLALVDEIVRRERQIESSNNEVLKAIESIGEIKADLGKLMTEREISFARMGEIDEEIATLKAQIEADERVKRTYEENVARCERERKSLAATKNEILSESLQVKSRVEAAREEVKTLTGTIQSLQTKCKILEDFKQEYDGFGGAVKKLMQSARNNTKLAGCIQGIVAEIIRVPKELETAIEMALGASMQNVVTANEDDAKYLIEFLKQDRLGRLTFLPMTSFKPRELEDYLRPITKEKGCLGVASKLISYDSKFNNILSGLLGRTLICEDMDSAIAIARRYKYAVKIVTLQGEILNPSGSMTGGSKKSETSNILSQEREIASAKELLAKAQARFQALSRQLRQDMETLEELQLQLNEYEEEVKNAEVAYATENGKLDKVFSKITVCVQDLQQRSESRKALEEKIKAIDAAIANIDKKGEDVRDLRSSVDDAAAKSKAEFDEKKRQKDLLNERLTDLRVKIKACETEIESLRTNIERTKQECESITAEIADCKVSVKQLDERIYQAEHNLNTAVVSDEDKKQYQEIVDKIASLDEYKKKLNAEIAELLAVKDGLNQEIMQISEARVKQEAALEKIDDVMANMELHIAEEYNLDYESAKSLRDENFDFSQAQSEINRVKRAKNALGSVNIDAIEEFRIEGARYREMSEERDDLCKTAADLEKIIQDVSKEMLDQFEREFAKINENFQIIFKELFGGGSGKLVIEPPEEGEDILDAGVEIMAEPPGKTLKSITLFSGGEKAMIAIAILFAILRLKAMPFCVLDEIEAALDDANAGLFAKYLGRFSKGTQFIVITHRKPTMELADRLYGVTMQEKGVSKIVSVSLADAVKQSEQEQGA